jgi:hypothetical protein
MVGVGALVVHYVTQVTEWRVMRDELLYVDLARSIAHSFAPLPVVRGEHVSVYGILYPLIIAPFVGALDPPAAFQVIRVVNVVLMVSTAIPAYLLAREASGSRAAAAVAATLTVLVPWMTQTTSVMTEVAGYPTFTWAVYAMTRAVAIPSPRRDVVALGAIAIACLARTQFLVLLLAFPIAVLVHHIGRRFRADGRRRIRSVLVRGTREALGAHVVIAVVAGAGVLLLVFASSVLLGSYAVTTSKGGLVPAGLPHSTVEHLAYITVGIGALPVVFGLAFVFDTLGRTVDARQHAVASVILVVALATTLAVASFDLRFITLGRTVQERYLFYISPLFFAGAVGWFVRGRASAIPLALAASITAGIVLSRGYEPLPEKTIEGFASPNRYFFAVLDGRLRQVESHFGVQAIGPAVAIAATCVLTAALAMVLLKTRHARLTLSAFAISLGAFLAAQLVYVLPRVVDDHNAYSRSLFGPRPIASRNWVDKRVAGNTGAVQGAINSRGGQPISEPYLNSLAWWDLEFWNRSVDRAYSFGTRSDDGLTPVRLLSLDYASGALHASGGPPPRQLVVASSDVRFAPEYKGAPVSHGDLTLYRTPLPYRASWATRGVDEDGWTHAGDRVVLRVYARRDARGELVRVRMLLGAGAQVGGPRSYTLSGPGVRRNGIVRTTAAEQFDVCPRGGRHTDVRLDVHGGTRLPDRRLVGLRLLLIQATPTGHPCASA